MRIKTTKIFCIMVLVGVFTLASTLAVPANAQYDLYWSTSSDRSNPKLLDGATVSGIIYVFTSPDTAVDRVRFYLDDVLHQVENFPRYDFDGTAPGGLAWPTDTTKWPDGDTRIRANIESATGGVEVVYAYFTVDNIGEAPLTILRIEKWGASHFFSPPGAELCSRCPDGFYATGGEASGEYIGRVQSYRKDARTWCGILRCRRN